jgi:hypothetical protein
MRYKILLIGIFGLLLLITLSTGYAYLADYSLPWWTVDGGGGSSNNDQYVLNGTLGQPDSGVMANEKYTLAGGFWGGSTHLESQFYLPLINR